MLTCQIRLFSQLVKPALYYLVKTIQLKIANRSKAILIIAFILAAHYNPIGSD